GPHLIVLCFVGRRRSRTTLIEGSRHATKCILWDGWVNPKTSPVLLRFWRAIWLPLLLEPPWSPTEACYFPWVGWRFRSLAPEQRKLSCKQRTAGVEDRPAVSSHQY